MLYRLDLDPYLPARNVLEHLQASDVVKTETVESETKIKIKIKTETDVLRTCHQLCWEAIRLPGSGKPYDPDQIFGDHQVLIFQNFPQFADLVILVLRFVGLLTLKIFTDLLINYLVATGV